MNFGKTLFAQIMEYLKVGLKIARQRISVQMHPRSVIFQTHKVGLSKDPLFKKFR